jgi:hypothetical protein
MSGGRGRRRAPARPLVQGGGHWLERPKWHISERLWPVLGLRVLGLG